MQCLPRCLRSVTDNYDFTYTGLFLHIFAPSRKGCIYRYRSILDHEKVWLNYNMSDISLICICVRAIKINIAWSNGVIEKVAFDELTSSSLCLFLSLCFFLFYLSTERIRRTAGNSLHSDVLGAFLLRNLIDAQAYYDIFVLARSPEVSIFANYKSECKSLNNIMYTLFFKIDVDTFLIMMIECQNLQGVLNKYLVSSKF